MDETHQLNEEYKSLVSLIRAEDRRLAANPLNPTATDENASNSDEEEASTKVNVGELEVDPEEDEWDQLAKQFATTTQKATPSEPLKTDEDMARAEQGRLVQLETLRLKRMANEELDEADLALLEGRGDGKKKKARKEGKKSRASAAAGPDDINSEDERYLPDMSDSSAEESDEEESGEEGADSGEGENEDAAPAAFEQGDDLDSDNEAPASGDDVDGLGSGDVDSDTDLPRGSQEWFYLCCSFVWY